MNITKIRNLLGKEAVIDNNIICDFTELGSIELLNKVFSKVLIPESILNDEVKLKECQNMLSYLHYISVSIENFETYEFMNNILEKHGGLTDYDAEVVSIAHERYVLCTSNERRIMVACEENDIESTGSLGIICCAYEHSIIDFHEFERLIFKLFNECSCFLSKKVKVEIYKAYGIDENIVP